MKIQKRTIIYVVYSALFLLLLRPTLANITHYFSDQINFQPDEARSHPHGITFIGNLTIEPPPGFTLLTYSPGLIQNGDNLIWNSTTSKTINFTLSSVDNCTEGEIFESKIYLNDAYYDKFNYVCIPDNKVVDFKIEYGHGDANYLSNDELYISNESATIFNLIRVWNIGHYLDPHEPAINANIECSFERDYTVRTYGRTNITYFDDNITAKFHWDTIESGYWFRIGVVSQEVKDKALGEFYNVSCGNLTYSYNHQQVQATLGDYGLEVRSITPLNITVHSVSSTKSKYIINNTEKYPVYFLYFDRLINGYTRTQYITKLEPDDSASYEVDIADDYNSTILYIPSWYRNSRNPHYYVQEYNTYVVNGEIRSTQQETATTTGGTGSGGGRTIRRPAPSIPVEKIEEILEKNCIPWGECSEYNLQTRSCEVTKKVNGEIITETIWEDQTCKYTSAKEKIEKKPSEKEEVSILKKFGDIITKLIKKIAELLPSKKKALLYILAGVLTILLLWLIYHLWKPKVILDMPALSYIAKKGVPLKKILQKKFGKKVSIMISYDTFEAMLKQRKKTYKQIIQLVTKNNVKIFKTKNLARWAKLHRAKIVTTNIKKYAKKNLNIYRLAKKTKLSKLKK